MSGIKIHCISNELISLLEILNGATNETCGVV